MNMKVINKAKTRAELSNPYIGIPHKELLKKAGVKTFTKYEIEDLGNGFVKLIPKY